MAKKHEHKTHKTKEKQKLTEEELIEWAEFLYDQYQKHKKKQKNDHSFNQKKTK